MHNYINFHLTLNLGLFLIFMRFDTYMQNVILFIVYQCMYIVRGEMLPIILSLYVSCITCFDQPNCCCWHSVT